MGPLALEMAIGLVNMAMKHEAGADSIQKCIEACKASEV